MMIVIAPQRLHYNMLIRKNMKGRDENKDEEAEESRKVAARRRNPQRRDKKITDVVYVSLRERSRESQTRRWKKKRTKEKTGIYRPLVFGEGRAKAKRPGRPIPIHQ